MKTFAAAIMCAAVQGYAQLELSRAEYGPTKDFGAQAHDRIWGHGHYEPGDVERFDKHFAEIYGADDLAWGPNGFQNPHTHSDTTHNWDDQGDGYICHACGGHGCSLCGGYGHQHKRAQQGHHGHNLKTGFGVGHNHAYLGDKPRSSYNRYGHGVGGRYTQRWTNGYGNRYGIGHGERYGLAHRWSQYNGYGHGNPSSKGSVMGYGLGANAAIPQRFETASELPQAVKYEPEYYEEEYYTPEYDHYEPEYDHYEPEYDHYEPEYDHYEPEYDHYEPEYDHYEPEYDHYEPEYAEYEEADYEMSPRGAAYGRKDKKMSSKSPYDDAGYYIDFARGYGAGPKKIVGTGKGHAYQLEFGHGAGNHSPWHGNIYRNDAGVLNYRRRPKKQSRFHTVAGYGKNEHF